jgi:hypothetical protein
VRNPDLSWREAKKQLRKDHRYSLAELLTKEDKVSMGTTTGIQDKRSNVSSMDVVRNSENTPPSAMDLEE